MRLSVSSQKQDQCDKGNLSPFQFHCRAESGCLCSLAVHWRSSVSSLGLGYIELPASSSRVLNSKRLPLLRRTRCSPTWQQRGEECPAAVPGVAFVPNQAGGSRLCPAPAFVPSSVVQRSPFGGPRPHQTQPLDSHFLPQKRRVQSRIWQSRHGVGEESV